jgi:Tol biopolymer transport system component
MDCRIAYISAHLGLAEQEESCTSTRLRPELRGEAGAGVFVNGRVTWSPDGEFVAFVGSDNPQAHLRGGNLTRILYRPFYLWICSAKTGKATKMRARPIAEDRTLFGQVDMLSVAWFGNQIILSLKQAGSANLWAGTVTPGTHELAGELTRLTLGSGNETTPSVSAGGKLVFANQGYSSGIWEALAGDASAPSMRRITQDRAVNYRPSVSTDGSKLAYVSDRTGNFDVWLKDLASGKDTPVTRSEREELFVAISRDGSQVAFWDVGRIHLAYSGGIPDCCVRSVARRWLDARWKSNHIARLDLDSIELEIQSSLLPRSSHIKFGTRLRQTFRGTEIGSAFHTAENVQSPGMGLENRRQVFIVPYTGQWSPPESWISVTDGSALDREPKWSTDGNRIYFLSDRDGFRCIWARNLDAKTKQPLESIYPVVHLHDSHLSLLHIPNTGNVSICPVGDKLIFAMGELSGNIWMTDLHQK